MNHVTLIAGTYIPTRCGVAHYTEKLRNTLQAQDIKSAVLTTHNAAQATCDPSVIGVVHGWGIADLLPLARSLLSTRTDLLHIQHAAGTYGFERAIFLLPLLLRMLQWRTPIVTTIHEYGWWEWQPKFIPPQLLEGLKSWGQQQGWWDREDGFLLTQSDAIITTNSDAEQIIQARLPQLSDRLHRIPIAANVEVAAIDKDEARQVLRQTCNWSNDTQVIVFFGFLHPVKGIENLLAAFKQVIAARSQARLLLVGGVESLALRGEQASQYWDKLHQLVTQLNLDTTVYITGYLPAETASHYIAGADVGVLPFNCGVTLKSGSLLTLLAHGLPVVATHNEPPDRDLAAAQVCLVTPRDNVDSLAISLIELLANPDKCLRLSDAGRSFVRNFAWEAIAKTHVEIYQKIS